MPYDIDETHDPELESWVESANDRETDFPIQNLPFFIAQIPGYDQVLATRIGDRVVNIAKVAAHYFGDSPALQDLVGPTSVALYDLCAFMTEQRRELRQRLIALLRSDAAPFEEVDEDYKFMYQVDEVTPVGWDIGDYTDFYASVHHATNVGSMFRPDNPLLPNYKHVPIGYHGRASSVVASGMEVRRPVGQQAPGDGETQPTFGPCKLLDYEMELGFIVGRGNELGEPIDINDAEDHLLGMCILNDWSARDLQKWEYQPLGPFLAKSFASTISPYIVTMEALAPFRCAPERAAGDPEPLPYLQSEYNRSHGAIDIQCEVFLASAKMREQGLDPIKLSRGNFRHMYWTVAQMLTHHASNGCNMQPGDLLGSGTISGTTRDSRGSLLELTWDGDPFAEPPVVVPGTSRTPLKLPTGEERKFLADGDEVIMKAFCQRDGYRRIGFGECRGIVTPAH